MRFIDQFHKKKKREGGKGKTVVKNTKEATVKFARNGGEMKKGSRTIAKGCGRVMDKRRKQTLYTQEVEWQGYPTLKLYQG